MSGTEYWRRRIRRHTLLAALAVLGTAGLYAAVPTTNIWRRLAVASAFSALGFLCGALAVGPVRMLRRRPVSVSLDFRRDVGIWSGILSIVHVGVSLRAHFGGRFWYYFVYQPSESTGVPVRTDAMGISNYAGLAATLAVLLLLAISNDAAVRVLGAGRWKGLQRLTYLVFVLVAVHGVVFQGLTNRPWPAVVLLWSMLVGVSVLQVVGAWTRMWSGSVRRSTTRGLDVAAGPPRGGARPRAPRRGNDGST